MHKLNVKEKTNNNINDILYIITKILLTIVQITKLSSTPKLIYFLLETWSTLLACGEIMCISL